MSIKNTGRKIYQFLQQYNILTGAPTGNVKPNLPTDPDYIAPITDLIACPLLSSVTEGLSQLKATIINNTSQFINCAQISITIQGSSPLYNQALTQGPLQTTTSNFQTQSNNIGLISITTTTSSLSLPCLFKIIWIRNGLSYLIYTSNSFVFDGSTLSVPPIDLPFNMLGETNDLQIIFEDIVQETTTTTTGSTTTTSTTSTTTEDPNANILVFVDPLTDPSTEISYIVLLNDQNEKIATIAEGVTSSNGLQQYSVPKGIYRIHVHIIGTGGKSIIIQQPSSEVSQAYLTEGIYCFEQIDNNAGLTILVNENVSDQSTVYAKIDQDVTEFIESTPTMPYGLIKKTKALVKVFFFEDEACSIPTTFQSDRVNFSIKLTDNITSLEVTTINFENYPIGLTEVLIADLIREQVWDYTLNDPGAIEIEDLTSDISYEYDLLPTFGLLKV